MIKVIVLGNRKPGMDLDEFRDYCVNKHAPLVRSCPWFWQRCNRYVQNHVFGVVDFQTRKVVTGEKFRFDVCAEFWFDSVEQALAAFSCEDHQRLLRPDELEFGDVQGDAVMLLTTEHLLGGSHPILDEMR